MTEETWTKTLPDGRTVSYCYHQSESGAWATRKLGEFGDTYSPVTFGLTRREVEDLFENTKQ